MRGRERGQGEAFLSVVQDLLIDIRCVFHNVSVAYAWLNTHDSTLSSTQLNSMTILNDSLTLGLDL